jgi:hypothetical protein
MSHRSDSPRTSAARDVPVYPASPGDTPAIRVGKVALPALRTMRAVLPHGSPVAVASSGMSRGFAGVLQGEKPLIREEGVGPAPVVGFAADASPACAGQRAAVAG